MKKILPILLALMLLAGCAGGEEEATTEATVAAGLYLPDSDVEKQTKGQVKAYALEDNGYYALGLCGKKPVLFGAGGRIETLNGDEPAVEQRHMAGDRVPYGTPAVSVGRLGIAYYRDDTHDIMCLNPMLSQTALVELPAEAQSDPAVCLDSQTVYYVAGNELRALELETSISRLIRSRSCKSQTIRGLYFDGAVIALEVTDENDRTETLYISAENGQTLSDVSGIETLLTYGDDYFISLMDGTTHQYAFGNRQEDVSRQLHMTGNVAGLVNTMQAVNWEQTEGGLTLQMVDLQKGVVSHTITLEDVTEPVDFLAQEGFLWLLAKNEAGLVTLYRWELGEAASGEGEKLTTELYTAQNPDEGALAACQERVDALNETYGVKLAIWKDAVSMTGDHTITAEYQAEAIHKALDTLEEALAVYPRELFSDSMRRGYVRVCLVRAIDDGVQSVHYWQNKDAYIALTVDCDIPTELLRHMAYVVDSHTVTYSKEYDLWNKLNPEGFAYDLDLEVSLQRDNTYLEGEERAFVDKASMSFAIEDRCAIFLLACQPEGEQVFAESPILQTKLQTMCKAIREAYELRKSPETFLWEQYLATEE